MLLKSLTDASLETCKDFQSEEFSVDATVAMMVLRQKIYVRPAEAVVREVLSNARDANRENGKGTTPIEISLVQEDNPVFKVKDNGIGIGPERLKFFTSYGASTKRNSNNQTGGWGLGCKSPYAVSDQFTLETVWEDADGRKWAATYLFFINESNRSAFTVISQEEAPLNTATGTSVIVPIKRHEVMRYRELVQKVVKFWDHPCVKDSAFPVTNWSINRYAFNEMLGDNYCNGNDGLVLDGIAYPLDMDNFEDFPTSAKKVAERLTYFFNTGEIEVNPTREDVNYTSKITLDSIFKSAFSAKEKIKQKLLDDLKGEASAHPLFASYLLKKHPLYDLVGAEVATILNIKFSREDHVDAISTGRRDQERCHEDYFLFVRKANKSASIYPYGSGRNLSSDMQMSRRGMFSLKDFYNTKVKVVVQDVWGNQSNKYYRGALEGDVEAIVVIPTYGPKKDENGVEDPGNLEEVLIDVAKVELFKEAGFTLLSSYPKIDAPVSPHAPAQRAKRLEVNCLRDMRKKGCPASGSHVDKCHGGVFVVYYRGKGYTCDNRAELADCYKNEYNKVDPSDYPSRIPVWGVSPKALHLLDDKWITPHEYQETRKNRADKKEGYLLEIFNELPLISNISSKKALLILANRFGPSKLRKFLLEVLSAKGLLEAKGKSDRFNARGMYTTPADAEKKTKLFNDLQDTYPLLFAVSSHTYTPLRSRRNVSEVMLEEIIYYVRGKKK